MIWSAFFIYLQKNFKSKIHAHDVIVRRSVPHSSPGNWIMKMENNS